MNHSIEISVNRIRQYREAMGLAKARLAVMAEIPEGSTRNMDSDDWNPTLGTLRKLDKLIPNDFIPIEKSKNHTRPIKGQATLVNAET